MPRIVQTIVFEFENQEQRRALISRLYDMVFAERAPRAFAMSMDNEQRRAELMHEALDHCSDHDDLRYAIEKLYAASDLDDWSWDEYEKQE